MSPLPHYEVHEGRGPFLLLVHGMLSGRSQWLLNVGPLGRVARPVVVELWGHGRSPAPDDPALYSPDGYVATFERLRRRLGAERWWLCGQSFGAGLTLRYALTHPERIAAHVFTNTNGGLADAEAVAATRANIAARLALAADGLAGLERIPAHPIHARRLPETVKAGLLADAALHKPEGLAMTFRHASPEISVRQRIHENRVPTLLLAGRHEARFRPVRDFVAREMPAAEVVDLDGGHGVNIQAADAFNAAVAAFLGKHPVREPAGRADVG